MYHLFIPLLKGDLTTLVSSVIVAGLRCGARLVLGSRGILLTGGGLAGGCGAVALWCEGAGRPALWVEAAGRPQYLDFSGSGICSHAPVSGLGLSSYVN